VPPDEAEFPESTLVQAQFPNMYHCNRVPANNQTSGTADNHQSTPETATILTLPTDHHSPFPSTKSFIFCTVHAGTVITARMLKLRQ
jgi:hypothetical protein